MSEKELRELCADLMNRLCDECFITYRIEDGCEKCSFRKRVIELRVMGEEEWDIS